jgi:riboflavin transporter FmnP
MPFVIQENNGGFFMQSNTKKLLELGILGALAIVLTYIGEFIPYFVPFLKLDISDIIIITILVRYGFKEAILIALLRVVVHGLIFGPVGPIYIGQLTILIGSITLATSFHFNPFKDRLLKTSFTVLVTSITLVILNFFFITPIYFGYPSVFSDGAVTSVIFGEYGLSSFGTNYLSVIITIYFPFNIIKTGLVLYLFELVKRAIPEHI